MYAYSLVLYISLIYLCNGTFGAHIFMHVYKNKTGRLYDESPTIQFEEEEAVILTCNIDGNTVKDGIYPTLTWIDGSKKSAPSKDISIDTTKILKKEDDGAEIQCKARSEVLDKEWSISVYFEKKKTAEEILSAKSNFFKLFLIGIGGALGAVILLLILYRLFLCCSNKCVSDEALDTENDNVIYSEIDRNTKKDKNLSNNLTEIGFDNIACHLKENDTYISFDSPEADQHSLYDNAKTLDIQNSHDSGKITINDEKNEKNSVKISLENTEKDSDC